MSSVAAEFAGGVLMIAILAVVFKYTLRAQMVEDDRYCIDVLTQVSAVKAALESVALLLLADHTEHCVAEAIRAGDGDAKVKELNGAVERLVKA